MTGNNIYADNQRYPDEGCEHCTLLDCKYNGAVTKNCPYRPKEYGEKKNVMTEKCRITIQEV